MKTLIGILLIFISHQIVAQPCQNILKFPANDLTAPSNFDTLLVSDQNYAGDYYSAINFTLGDTYIFTSSTENDIITLRSQDQLTVLAFGTTPLEYTVESDTAINVHINIENCGTQFFSRETNIIHTFIEEVSGVGINTDNPQALLDVNGKIKISNDENEPLAGMLRYNAAIHDFEGYDGKKWRSLTKSSAVWGKTNAPTASASTKIIADDGEDFDLFGSTMDMDGNKIAISAPYLDDGGNGNVGAIYIYQRDGNDITFQQKLLDVNATGSEQLGNKDIMIDGNQLITSSNGIQDNGSNGGVRIFTLTNDAWTLEASLDNGSGNNNFNFGGAVAIDGNYAAVRNSNLLNGMDEIIIFKKNGLQWQEHQTIVSPTNSGTYGFDLAFLDDQLIIGDPDYFDNETIGGRVEIWEKNNQFNYEITDSLANPSSTPNLGDLFGHRIDVSGDRMIIASPHHTTNNNFHGGAAYIYKKTNGIWNLEQSLYQDIVEDGARFSFEVALFDDQAIVQKSGLTNTRKIYVYKMEDTWQLESILVGDLVDNYVSTTDLYGASLAISENLILVGGRNADVGDTNNQGLIYIYCK